jgi:hypothetical protein
MSSRTVTRKGEIMARSRHPKKEVEEALKDAEEKELKVEQSRTRAHKWGDVACHDTDHRKQSVWSTPQDPGDHANDIKRYSKGHQDHGR